MARKTIVVRDVVKMANEFLLNSRDEDVEQRKGVFDLTCNVLHNTGNYNGYGWNEKETDLHHDHYGKDARLKLY